MKKAIIVLGLVLVVAMFPNIVSAASTGYERFVDSESEVFLEYFPIVPVDSAHPTASEEFPIKFTILQKDWWLDPIGFFHVIPKWWSIDVFWRDKTTGVNSWLTWKRWFPTSVTEYGMRVDWSLSGSYKGVGLGATVKCADAWAIETDYSSYDIYRNGEQYRHLGSLKWIYNSNYWWFGQVYAEGAGSIGIPNDLASQHIGDHIEILVVVTLNWSCLGDSYDTRVTSFVLGDDNPSLTDCWLTVEESHVEFSTVPVIRRSRGGRGSARLI